MAGLDDWTGTIKQRVNAPITKTAGFEQNLVPPFQHVKSPYCAGMAYMQHILKQVLGFLVKT